MGNKCLNKTSFGEVTVLRSSKKKLVQAQYTALSSVIISFCTFQQQVAKDSIRLALVISLLLLKSCFFVVFFYKDCAIESVCSCILLASVNYVYARKSFFVEVFTTPSVASCLLYPPGEVWIYSKMYST